MRSAARLLGWLWLVGVCWPASAETPELALETVVSGSRTQPTLSAPATTEQPETSPSAALGEELSRLFQEGAKQLEPPRPKKAATVASQADGVPTGGRTLKVLAYSYCLTGRTASGRSTAPGIVAVDPRVIPMGSKLYIPGYGWGVAADTGGAIMGNKIDVWFPSLGQCYQWGVRPVTIQVFPK